MPNISATQGDAISHSCNENKCQGSVFNGLHFKCSKCGEKIFMECIRDRAGSSEILTLLGVITSTNAIQNTQYAQSQFNLIFNHNSPFALTCDFCRFRDNNAEIIELRRQLKEKNDNCAKLESEIAQLKFTSDANKKTPGNQSSAIECFGAKMVELIQSAVKTELDSMSDTNSFSHSSQDIVPVNGIYAIHLSKALKEATTDDITELILDKMNLNIESFKVEKLVNRRYRGKNKEFSSFKISTFTRSVFDKIMNDDIWEPCIVKPFIYKDSMTKQNKSKQYASKNIKNRNKQVNSNFNVASQPKINNNSKTNNRNSNGDGKRNKKTQSFLLNRDKLNVDWSSSRKWSQQQKRQSRQQHQRDQQEQREQQQQQSPINYSAFDNENSFRYDMRQAAQHHYGVPFGYHQSHFQPPQLHQMQHLVPSTPKYAQNFLPFRGYQPMYQI